MANGTIWKVLGFAVSVAVLAGSIIYGYATMGSAVAVQGKDIAEMQPEVQRNSEHRIYDEVDTRYIKEKIASIERTQKQILEEVRK